MISYENLRILHNLTEHQIAKLPIVVGFLYFTPELRIPKHPVSSRQPLSYDFFARSRSNESSWTLPFVGRDRLWIGWVGRWVPQVRWYISDNLMIFEAFLCSFDICHAFTPSQHICEDTCWWTNLLWPVEMLKTPYFVGCLPVYHIYIYIRARFPWNGLFYWIQFSSYCSPSSSEPWFRWWMIGCSSVSAARDVLSPLQKKGKGHQKISQHLRNTTAESCCKVHC